MISISFSLENPFLYWPFLLTSSSHLFYHTRICLFSFQSVPTVLIIFFFLFQKQIPPLAYATLTPVLSVPLPDYLSSFSFRAVITEGSPGPFFIFTFPHSIPSFFVTIYKTLCRGNSYHQI